MKISLLHLLPQVAPTWRAWIQELMKEFMFIFYLFIVVLGCRHDPTENFDFPSKLSGHTILIPVSLFILEMTVTVGRPVFVLRAVGVIECQEKNYRYQEKNLT